MITILFFAQIRELVGLAQLAYPCDDISIEELLQQLSQKGDKWAYALQNKNVLCAVNKVLVESNHIVKNGDEVAFFPPVTGG